jgi:DNA sulfur modification protein DndB
VWVAILEELEDELTRRKDTVVSAPAILGGIGIVAHHAVTSPPRRVDEWSVDEVLERLQGVNWERTLVRQGRAESPWDGIAGKFTPSNTFSIGGPKEVGHAVADALENPDSTGGRAIRS